MTNQKNTTSLVTISNSNLAVVKNSFSITNKLLFGDIENDFNKAFCLLNSKTLKESAENFLFYLENHKDYRKEKKFSFTAINETDYEKAIGIFTEIIKIKPFHALSYEMRGIAKKRLKKYSDADAVNDLTKAIEIDPSSSWAYFYRAKLTFDKDFPDAAMDDFKKSIEIDPNNIEIYLLSAFFKNRLLHDFGGSINDYTKAIEIDPSNFASYISRARVKLRLKNYSGAIDDYIKAIEIDPGLSSHFFSHNLNFNLAYFDMDDITKAIEINPNNSEAYFWRGEKRRLEKNYSGAIDDYTIAIQIDPNNSEAYFWRGSAKYKLNDYLNAIEDFSKAIQIDPNNSEAYFWRGSAKYKLNDFSNAIEDFTKAIQIDPNTPYYFASRGWAKNKLNDFFGAQIDHSIFRNNMFKDTIQKTQTH